MTKEAPSKSETSGDWKAQKLAHVRALIQDAVPDVIEEYKWKKPTNPQGVPTWSHGGIICTGETYKEKIKLTFMHGASLPDPQKLFNAGLYGGTRRAMDIFEQDTLNEKAFKALIRDASELNISKT